MWLKNYGDSTKDGNQRKLYCKIYQSLKYAWMWKETKNKWVWTQSYRARWCWLMEKSLGQVPWSITHMALLLPWCRGDRHVSPPDGALDPWKVLLLVLTKEGGIGTRKLANTNQEGECFRRRIGKCKVLTPSELTRSSPRNKHKQALIHCHWSYSQWNPDQLSHKKKDIFVHPI